MRTASKRLITAIRDYCRIYIDYTNVVIAIEVFFFFFFLSFFVTDLSSNTLEST